MNKPARIATPASTTTTMITIRLVLLLSDGFVGDEVTGANDGEKVVTLVGRDVVTNIDGELEASTLGTALGENDMLGRAVGATDGGAEIVGAGV